MNLLCIFNYHIYRRETKFAKVMFSQVSVCPRRGGVWPIACWDIHSLGRYTPKVGTPSRAGTTLPGQVHPHRQTPLPVQCMLGYTHPCPVHAGIQSTSGRCASHWNALLFHVKFHLLESVGFKQVHLSSSRTKIYFDNLNFGPVCSKFPITLQHDDKDTLPLITREHLDKSFENKYHHRNWYLYVAQREFFTRIL